MQTDIRQTTHTHTQTDSAQVGSHFMSEWGRRKKRDTHRNRGAHVYTDEELMGQLAAVERSLERLRDAIGARQQGQHNM